MAASISSVRAPRQSGLKKPRPLRSMSSSTAVEPSEKKELLRPLSLGSSECEAAAVSSQPSPVCREIAAMSALLVAEAGQAVSPHVPEPLPRPGKASASMPSQVRSHGPSAAMYARANSTPNGECEISKPAYQRRYSSEDSFTAPQPVGVDTNNSHSFDHCHTSEKGKLQGLQNENIQTQESCSLQARNSGVEEKARSPRGSQVATTGTGAPHLHSKAMHASSVKENPVHPGLESLSHLENGIVFATLKTVKGEEFVVSAKSIQTIICITRVLVSELGAKIEKLEAFPNEDPSTTSGTSEPEEESSSMSYVEPISKVNPGPKYSKEELLGLSRSVLSRQPPSSWQLLSQAYPDICLPRSKVQQFFDPIDFHPHDGSMVVESYSLKEQRDRRRV